MWSTGADYYLANVANSVDDYYLGRGEAPGQWIGATSAALDLTGVVDSGVLRNLLDGRGGGGRATCRSCAGAAVDPGST